MAEYSTSDGLASGEIARPLIVPAQPGWQRVTLWLDELPEGEDPAECLEGPFPVIAWLITGEASFPLVPGEGADAERLAFLWEGGAAIDPSGKLHASYGVTFRSIPEWMSDAVERHDALKRAREKRKQRAALHQPTNLC